MQAVNYLQPVLFYTGAEGDDGVNLKRCLLYL